MYEELFSKVPDHPRLTRRTSEQFVARANRNKLSLIGRFLGTTKVFAEFGPGDCTFSYEVARRVKYTYGIDISDQRERTNGMPENFKLIVYNGYDLPDLEDNSVDIAFSDQLIEHFHPEDTRLHFELVRRILKDGGKYVFRTPHALTGPHDVSGYFSDEPECFHLKEWTYIEIGSLLKKLKYSDFHTCWCARGINLRVPYFYFAVLEHVLGAMPKRYVRKPARYLIPSLLGVAIK